MTRWDARRARRKGGNYDPDRVCLRPGCSNDTRPRVGYCSDECSTKDMADRKAARERQRSKDTAA